MQIQSLLRCLALLSAVLTQTDAAVAARVVSITASKEVVEPGYMAVDVTDRFALESPEIHVVALLTETARGSRFTGRWISLDAMDQPNFVIAETEQEVTRDGRARLHFLLIKPTGGWRAGSYRFDLYHEEERLAQVGFAVGASAGPAPSPVAATPDGDALTTAPPGASPALGPPTPPATQLIGSWESEVGEVLILGERSYAFYEYRQLVDDGTYAVEGTTLTTRSEADGHVETYRFQADATTLLLEDGLGTVWAFQRSK